MRNNCRGDGGVTLIVLLAVLGATQLVPNWRIDNWFKKGPPTKELTEAQKKLDAADKRAVEAEANLQRLVEANAAKKDNQIVYSHEMIAGAIESNSHAPDSTEKAITDAFLQRADIGLSSALKPLDPALKAEVVSIVAQLRSGDVEKIKAANAMLAEKDKQLAQATIERAKLEQEATVAKAQVVTAEKEKAALKEVVATKQNQVILYADKAREKEVEAGSFGATVQKLGWGLGILTALYILANWVLPSLAQEFPNARLLVGLNKTVKSVTSAHA